MFDEVDGIDDKKQEGFFFHEEDLQKRLAGTLVKRFIVPPFSILDARQGYWQARKRAWFALGIQSELGRGENLTLDSKEVTTENLNYYRNKEKRKLSPGGSPACNYKNKERGDGAGKSLDREGKASGTSIFDPVLCEITYRWYCPPAGRILDPFAGGSVRGIVAAYLGYQYTGIDLSGAQVEANRKQWRDIRGRFDLKGPEPQWIEGDACDIEEHVRGMEFDFVFSCPPYFDLEVYSEDKRDLSTMSYDKFRSCYRNIIEQSVKLLKPNRFATFIVGEVRKKGGNGEYRNFIPETIAAFYDAMTEYYNEAILITSVGSLPIRVTKQFLSKRKIGKTHQNVLTFVKGCPGVATQTMKTKDEALVEYVAGD